jgi:hypothetical protein
MLRAIEGDRMMLVELKKLKPNSLRDFKVDPVDPARVRDLQQSIHDDGFWGGIVCRRLDDGTIEIVAGHSRTAAAIEEGIKTADVFVADGMDDATAVRVYSRENATQRGNAGTAQAGSVAAAIRLIAKGLATDSLVLTNVNTSQKAMDAGRGTLASGEGVGARLVMQLLDGIPGVSLRMVNDQLANLKSSGQYARIIGDVKEEIERENREALKELERREKAQKAAEEAARKAEEERKVAAARAKAAREEAEKQRAELARQKAEAEAKLAVKRQQEMAAKVAEFNALKKMRDTITSAVETASEREVTFHPDVDKVLTVPSHASEFRRLVESPGVQPYVTVAQQPRLARDIVAEAKELGDELTAGFIRTHIGTLARYGRTAKKREEKSDREARERDMIVSRYRRLIEELGAAFRSVTRISSELADLERGWPRGTPKPYYGAYIEDLRIATKAMQQLNRKVGNE